MKTLKRNWIPAATFAATGLIVSGIAQADDRSDYYFGIGAEYQFTPQWSVTGGWDRYQLEDDDVDIDNLHVGVRYRF